MHDTTQHQPPPNRNRQAAKILIGIGGAVLVAVALLVWYLIPSAADNAAAACHDDIRFQAKDPDSVEFRSTETARVEDAYHIVGVGSGANSFGATVSFVYECTVFDSGAVESDIIE